MFAKIKRFYALWKNPIFQVRYVENNIANGNITKGMTFPIVLWADILKKIKKSPWKIIYLLPFYIFWRCCDSAEHRNFSGRKAFKEIRKNPFNVLFLPAYIFFFVFRRLSNFRNNKLKKLYIFYRLWNNKIDLPKFDFVITSRCTLNCESCNSLMPYFPPKTAYTCTVEGFIQTLDIILKNVTSVRELYIVGGEPLMVKDLHKIVDYLNNQSKIQYFVIITNATIKPNEKLLKALFNARERSRVLISDYSKSPNIHTRLQADDIIKILEENQIQWIFWHTEYDARWTDFGKIYKRNRDKAGIIRNFRNCLNACVAVRSNETGFNYGGGGVVNTFFAKLHLPFPA